MVILLKNLPTHKMMLNAVLDVEAEKSSEERNAKIFTFFGRDSINCSTSAISQ